MPKLPPTRPKDLVRIARKLGFVLDRQKGSHAVYVRQDDGRRIVIPMYKGDLKTGTLRGIVTDMGLTVGEVLELKRGYDLPKKPVGMEMSLLFRLPVILDITLPQKKQRLWRYNRSLRDLR